MLLQSLIQNSSSRCRSMADLYQFSCIHLSFPPRPARGIFANKKTAVTMSVMIIHIIVSLIIALGFLAAFVWAMKSNQYEDDYSPGVRILYEDKNTENE